MKKKEFITYLVLFCLFFIILCLSPISGDDWGNYLIGAKGIYHSIGNAIGMYFDWEGRFVSRIFINILTYHKLLWNFFNSLVLVVLIYFIIKLVNPKNQKLIFFLSLFVILFMNIYSFSQVVTWIAGNVTYLFVLPFLLYYFYHIIRNHDQGKGKFILFIILNFIMTMFVEHVAVILVAFNLIINICYIVKNRKINYRYLIYFLVSLFGFLLMFFSPGSMKRANMENVEFNQLSLFAKILYNIPNFIYYTFLVNGYMLFLMIWANYYLIQRNFKNKYFKMGLYLLFLPLPLFLFGLYALDCVGFNLNIISLSHHLFLILYFIIYIIFDFYLFCITLRRMKQKDCLLFYVLGILANGVMLLSPTWGYRTSFLSYLFLSISFIMVIDSFYQEKRFLHILLPGIAFIAFGFYLVLYSNIHHAQLARERSIEKQGKRDVIEIEIMPGFANCNINPTNEFHLQKFKEYYHIDKDTEIKLIEGNWKYHLFYRKPKK